MRPVPFALVGLILIGCAARERGVPAGQPGAAEPQGGEASPRAPSPAPAPEAQAEAPAGEDELYADLSTLEKAEAALGRAQSVLDGLYVAEGKGIEREETKKESAPARPRTAAPSRAPAEATEEKAQDDRSRCDTACRAFASLERAADAVCRLAGDAKDRCTRAKKLVDDNVGRVAACSCRR
jgi:hypothetical protein